MNWLVRYIFLFVVSFSFGQKTPIKYASIDYQEVIFLKDSLKKNTFISVLDSLGYYYVDRITINSFVKTSKTHLFVYSKNKQVVFHYKGNIQRGKYRKYYSSGELLAKGRLRKGEYTGYYKEYSKSGKILLNCYYGKNKIQTKNKTFYREFKGEVFCDKKWFRKVDYDACIFFPNNPFFLKLLSSSDPQSDIE